MLNSPISFGNSLMYATVLTEIYHIQLTSTEAVCTSREKEGSRLH
ncbi:hypothetical protein [Candidatus Nitrososphaera gargensis]